MYFILQLTDARIENSQILNGREVSAIQKTASINVHKQYVSWLENSNSKITMMHRECILMHSSFNRMVEANDAMFDKMEAERKKKRNDRMLPYKDKMIPCFQTNQL